MRSKRQPPQHASDKPYSLFNITADIEMLIRDITEAQQDKDLERIEELTDKLIDLIHVHENKYEATVHVIKNSLHTAEGNQAIANEFQAIATAHKNLAKRLKERLKEDMNRHGLTKVNAGIFSIRTQKNNIASLKVLAEPEALPEQFQVIKIDTDELRAALAAGEEIEGATLEKGEHIRITAKR